MLENWRKYLALTWKTEPIGQRYLRRILVEFKFELNLLVAAMVVLIEFQWLRCQGLMSAAQDLWGSLALIVAVGCLFYAARDSSLLLADLRALLIETRSESARMSAEL